MGFLTYIVSNKAVGVNDLTLEPSVRVEWE